MIVPAKAIHVRGVRVLTDVAAFVMARRTAIRPLIRSNVKNGAAAEAASACKIIRQHVHVLPGRNRFVWGLRRLVAVQAIVLIQNVNALINYRFGNV